MSRKTILPEIFRYEAFNGDDGGLAVALQALQKLARLSELAQRGLNDADEDGLLGDDALMDELAEAITCATHHAAEMLKENDLALDGHFRHGRLNLPDDGAKE